MRRAHTLLIGVVLATAALVARAQDVTLTTPITAPTNTKCYIKTIVIEPALPVIGTQPSRPARIVAEAILGSTAEILTRIYDGTTTPTASTLLHNLNIGNYSGATPLITAVWNRLNADGVCVGTVGGTIQ